MAGKNIGKLSIKVIPDTATFKEELLKSIKRMEKTMRMKLDVDANTYKAELALVRFRNLQESKPITLKVSADVADARVQIDEAARNKRVTLAAIVSTTVAKTQMAVLSRDRKVTLFAKVNQASFATASAALSRLSGFRIAEEILTDVRDSLKNLDLAVPKIARVALAIAGIVAPTLQASAGIITLTGDIAKMGNAAFILPAAFTGAAIGILTLAMALKDSKTELAQFGPAMGQLQDSMSDEFWAKAKEPIVDLVNSVLPSARAGFAQTAAAIGEQASVLAQAFQRTLGGGVLDAMFLRLKETIDAVTTGASGFAEAITTIGTVGSNYLPRLGQWVADITNQFNAWIQGIAASGELDAFIEDGITQMKLFGASIADITRMFKGIDSAATAAGGTGLANFAESMKSAAEATNSPAFQLALTTILQGANRGLDGIAGGFSKFGTMLGVLAPQISTVFSLVGQTVGGLLGSISDALDQPAFKNGLIDFFAGIKGGVDALGPAMGPLFAFIGQLGTTIGALALTIGTVLAAIKITFAPVLESILAAVTPLIPMLGEKLTGAINALAPIMQGLGTFISENEGFVRGLVLVLGGLALGIGVVSGVMRAYQAVMAVVKAVQFGYAAATYGSVGATYAQSTATRIGMVAQKAATLAQGAATIATKLFNAALSANPIGLIITAIIALVAGLVWFFTQTKIGQAVWATFIAFLTNAWTNIQAVAAVVFTAISTIITNVWTGIIAFIAGAINMVQAIIAVIGATIAATWNAIWTGISAAVMFVWNAIVWYVTTYIALIVAIVTTVGAVIAAVWKAIWDGISAAVMFVWNAIVFAVTFYINLIVTTITVIGAMIAAVWGAIWNGISTAVSAVWNAIVSAVSGAINGVLQVISYVLGFIGSVWSNAWNGLKLGLLIVVNAIKGLVTGMVDKVKETVTNVSETILGIKDKVVDAVSGAGDWLKDAGKAIVQGLIDGIGDMVGGAKDAIGGVMDAISNFLPHSPAKEGAFSGRGWTLYSGQALGEGLVDGIDSRVAQVRRSAGAMMSAASGVARIGVDAATSSMGAAATAVAGDSITVMGNVGYDPAAIAAEIALKKRQAAMVNGLSRVGVA